MDKPKRVIGIDYGLSRIGLALSDERQIIATPFQTLLTEKKMEHTVSALLAIVSDLEVKQKCIIEEIIVGLPLMMNGRMGFQADEVKHFVQVLAQATLILVKTWDERLSTVQAERSLRESSMSRKKRSKVVDVVSAAIILQSYLDSKQIKSQHYQ